MTKSRRSPMMASERIASIWPEADATLRARWSEGVPCAQIGLELGVSPHAVIGRAGRLDLGRHPSREFVVLRPREPRKPMLGPVSPPEGVALQSAPVPSRLPSEERCKFIAGDVQCNGWSYCGQPVSKPGSAWCAEHRRIVYQQRSAEQMRVQ